MAGLTLVHQGAAASQKEDDSIGLVLSIGPDPVTFKDRVIIFRSDVTIPSRPLAIKLRQHVKIASTHADNNADKLALDGGFILLIDSITFNNDFIVVNIHIVLLQGPLALVLASYIAALIVPLLQLLRAPCPVPSVL